eukprot:7279682-Karenia_brevis.AAC.1
MPRECLSSDVISFSPAISSCEKGGHLVEAGHASPTSFDAIAHEAKPCLNDLKSQQLANTAWAFAALDCASSVISFNAASSTSEK